MLTLYAMTGLRNYKSRVTRCIYRRSCFCRNLYSKGGQLWHGYMAHSLCRRQASFAVESVLAKVQP